MNSLYGFSLLAGCFGFIFGSFLNVAAVRMLKGESVFRSPIHCPACRRQLSLTDFIPALGSFILRGRCRCCGRRVSPAYPLGETVTGISFGITAWRLGPQPEVLAGLLLVSVLIVCVHTDWKTMIIPDKVTLPAMAVALALRWFVHPLPVWNYAAAFAIGAGGLLLLALLSRGGMGGGDIKLFGFVGLILGLPYTLWALFLSSFLGVLYGVILWRKKSCRKRTPLPFGPFIAAGAWIAYLWGELLQYGYLSAVSFLLQSFW